MVELTEHQIQNQILDYLKYKGLFWRQNTGAVSFKSNTGRDRFIRFGKKGISDILGCQKKNGQFTAIEIKRKGNSLTQYQEEFLKDVNRNGGLGMVAFSLDDVMRVIK